MNNLLQSLVLLGIGIVFGLEHALEADPVIAVTTLTSQSRSVRHAIVLATLWGLGHSVTLFVVGAFVLLLKINVSDQVAAFFEFLVGLLLIALGVNVIRLVLTGSLHAHPHEHDDVMHTHVHAHTHASDHSHHTRRSFLVGLLHGLAGSTALVLLVLSSFQSLALGLGFILCFGLGSVVGMGLITLLVAVPVKLSLNSEQVNRALQFVAGTAGVLVGVLLSSTRSLNAKPSLSSNSC